MTSIASAPAKIILLGEHFVVYGKPALVIAIEKRAFVSADFRKDNKLYIEAPKVNAAGLYFGKDLTVFKAVRGGHRAKRKLEPIKTAVLNVLKLYGRIKGMDITVKSDIPVAAGLGSSAAIAVATTAAVGDLLSLDLERRDIFRLALEAEKVIHGTPSGIDPAISTYGGTILYSRDRGIRDIKVSVDIPLVVGNTRLPRSTGTLVSHVRSLKKRYPTVIEPIVNIGGKIVEEALLALQRGDLKALGDLMNIDHGLLSAVGVSSKRLENLVYAAREAGALGAKLTGAGGGGCMIALTHKENLLSTKRAIEKAGGEAFTAAKTDEGVRIESYNT